MKVESNSVSESISHLLPRTIDGIKREFFGKHADRINTTDVTVSQNRISHVRRHHPEDYDRLLRKIDTVLKEPDIVYDNTKNNYSVVFAKQINAKTKMSQIVVVNLSKANKLTINTTFVKSTKRVEKDAKESIIEYVKGR